MIQLAAETKHELFLFRSKNNPIPQFNQGQIHDILIDIKPIKRIYYKLLRIVSNIVEIFIGEEFDIRKYIKRLSGEEKLIQNNNIDVMWYVGPHCVTTEVPYIFTVLDLQHRIQPYFPEVSNHGVWEKREKLYSEKMRRAAFVIVSTDLGKLEIEKFYQVPGDRIVVLPYAPPPVDSTSHVTNDVLKKYNLKSGYLFYPGQFWPQKNHVGLLHAIRLLRDEWNISLSAVFVGSDKGNQNYIKETITRLGLSKQVHILGFVPREDLIALYQNALALTMPTLVGPDNIPSLEAFALQCPVISSNLPGFKEQLGDAALLVDPKSEKQIALSIKALYEDQELRQRLIQKGLKRTAEWTWTDYVKGVIKIIDEFEPIRRTWSSKEVYK